MGRMQRLRWILAAAGALALLAGCATTPGSVKARPAWVDNPPTDTADTVYFVGYGGSDQGNVAQAQKEATNSLVSDVTRFIGVKITSDTTVQAKASLTSFEENVSAVIQEQSSALVSDFRISDRYTETTASGAVVVYLLGAYNRAALTAERDRFRKLFAERQAAVTGPEARGDELLGSGDFYRAAVQFLAAAAAATGKDVENADVKLERNINKAKEAVAKINLKALNDNLSGQLGKPFAASFDLAVYGGADADTGALSGVPIVVVFKQMRDTGKMGTRTATVRSNDKGQVAFMHPIPHSVGSDTVVMSLDLRASLDPLAGLKGRDADLLSGLERIVGEKKVIFHYAVDSSARTIPTAVIVFDRDDAGRSTGTVNTADGVIESMTAAKFEVKLLPSSTAYATLPEDEIVRQVALNYGKDFSRLVLGSGKITSFQESDGNYLVRVDGSVKTISLADGTVISQISGFETSRGGNADSAISAAFIELGKTLGEKLVNSLP